MIDENNQSRAFYKQINRQVETYNPNKYENHSEYKDSRRECEAEYDDYGNEEEAQSPERG